MVNLMLIYNGWRLLHDLLYVLSEKGYVVYNPKTKMGVYSLKFFFGYQQALGCFRTYVRK